MKLVQRRVGKQADGMENRGSGRRDNAGAGMGEGGWGVARD